MVRVVPQLLYDLSISLLPADKYPVAMASLRHPARTVTDRTSRIR